MKLLIVLCCLLPLSACADPMQYRLECQLDGTPTMISEVVEAIGYWDNAYQLWASKNAKYVYIPRPGEACVIKEVPRKR